MGFNRMFTMDVPPGDTIEIPLIFYSVAYRALVDHYVYEKPLDKLVFFPTCTSPCNVNGADTLLRKLVRNSVQQGFNKCVYKNDTIYYGCAGYIGYADFEPMMLSTITVKLKPNPNATRNHQIEAEVLDVNIYIHSDVFSKTDILSKSVVKKFLPFVSQRNYRVSNPIAIDCSGEMAYYQYHPNVIISNFEGLVVEPCSPTADTLNSDSIQKFLEEHTDDIMHQFRYVGI